jgi:hypothetical protein
MTQTQAQRIAQLEAQVALLTQATTALLQGELDGAGSAKAYLLAIDPTLQIEPAAFEFGE